MQRDILLQVARTCVANHAVTGFAFPCLEVNTVDGEVVGTSSFVAPAFVTSILRPRGQSSASTTRGFGPQRRRTKGLVSAFSALPRHRLTRFRSARVPETDRRQRGPAGLRVRIPCVASGVPMNSMPADSRAAYSTIWRRCLGESPVQLRTALSSVLTPHRRHSSTTSSDVLRMLDLRPRSLTVDSAS